MANLPAIAGFPQYTIAMNEMSSAPEYGLLASDSRLRFDRVALEHEVSNATSLKTQFEERSGVQSGERKRVTRGRPDGSRRLSTRSSRARGCRHGRLGIQRPVR